MQPKRGYRFRAGRLLLFLSFVAAAAPIGSAAGLANWLLRSPLPLPAANELQYVLAEVPDKQVSFDALSLPEFRQLERGLDDQIGFAAFATDRVLTIQGELDQRATGTFVTEDFYRTTGISLVAGAPPNSSAQLLASQHFAETRYKKASLAVGQTLVVDGQTFAVSGVIGGSFRGLMGSKLDLFLPIESGRTIFSKSYFEDPQRRWLVGIARAGQAQKAHLRDHLASEAVNLESLFPETHAGRSSQIVPVRDLLYGPNSRNIAALLLAGAVLAALGCFGNAIGLVGSEIHERRTELAIRASLGAPAQRIAAGILGPVLAISTLGILAGFFLSSRVTAALVAASGYIPASFSESVLRPKAPAVFMLLASSILLTGLVLRQIRKRVLQAPAGDLAAGQSSQGKPPGTTRLIHTVLLVAISGAMLMISLLTAQSLRLLTTTSIGLNTANVHAVEIDLPKFLPEESLGPAVSTLLRAIRTLPEIESAEFTGPSLAPYSFFSSTIVLPGESTQERTIDAFRHGVSNGYLDTLGIDLVKGRRPNQLRFGQRTGEALVSEEIAQQVWGDNAIGRDFEIRPKAGSVDRWTVVGIARNVQQRGHRDARQNDLYLPFSLTPASPIHVLMKTKSGGLPPTASALTELVRNWNPGAFVGPPASLDNRISEASSTERLVAYTSSLFALVAFILAAIGSYGVLASDVRSRSREWVIRRALGLTASDVFLAIIRKGAIVSAAASLIGVVGAIFVGRALQDLFFGLAAGDTFTAVVVFLVMIVTGVLAALPSAIRAARVEPSQALKQD